MKNIFFITSVLLISFSAHSLIDANTLNVEHQIRICDTSENILRAFNLKKASFKSRELYYFETDNLILKSNQLIIKIKNKFDRIEIDLKKRISIEDLNDYSDANCEFDKHDNNIELTCKYSHQETIQTLDDLKNHKHDWQNALSSEQLNFLENIKSESLNLKLFGTLSNLRYTIMTPDFSEISIDLVTLKSDNKINFHEISVRYPYNELEKKSLQFETLIKKSGLKLCLNQQDWDVKKFEVMKAF